jgi:hypothetical protein
MGKTAVLLPEKYKKIALANNISIQTVYGRLRRGWDVEKAVKVPPDKSKGKSADVPRKEGAIMPSDRPRCSKPISFYFYQDLEKILESAVKSSGLSRSEFISQVVEEYLLKWQKQKGMRRKPKPKK